MSERSSHSPSRRRLAKTGLAVGAAALVGLPFSGCDTPDKKIPLKYAENHNGIYIATQPEPVLRGGDRFSKWYTRLYDDPNDFYDKSVVRFHDHASVSKEESQLIKSALNPIPYAGELNDLVLTYRTGVYSDGGSYNMSGFHMAERWYQELTDRDGDVPPFPSRAIMLVIDSDIDYSQPSIQSPSLSTRTAGDDLVGIVQHEIGHALVDTIERSPEIDCDPPRDDGLPKVSFRNASSASKDPEHPLMRTFATLTNWRYGNSNIAKSLGSPGSYYAVADEKCVWINPWIDINLADKTKETLTINNFRVSDYATVNVIEESFAEFYRASLQERHLLTDPEKRYFDIIHNGMTKSPARMIEEIRANPQILLR